jgi:WD40 repeat protein
LLKDGPGVARESWEENYVKIFRFVTEPYETSSLEFPLTLKTFVRFQPSSSVVLAWSHDQNSSFLFSSGAIDKASLLLRWDANNWLPKPEDPPRSFDRRERVNVLQMAFSPTDPTRLALVSIPVYKGVHGVRSLEILDISRPDKVTQSFQGEHREEVYGFAWSPDGKEIAATFSRSGARGLGWINRVKIFDAATYKLLREKQISGAVSLDWSPDGKQLAITTTVLGGFHGPASSVEIWDGELKKKHKVFGGTGGRSLDWSPERKNKRPEDPFSSRIAMGNRKGIVTVVEVGVKKGDENKTGDLQELKFSKEQFSNAAHKFSIKRPHAASRGGGGSVAWSADGRMLAGISQKEIIIWDSDTLNVKEKISIGLAARFGAHHLVWRSDGKMIAAGIGNGTIRVFKDIK